MLASKMQNAYSIFGFILIEGEATEAAPASDETPKPTEDGADQEGVAEQVAEGEVEQATEGGEEEKAGEGEQTDQTVEGEAKTEEGEQKVEGETVDGEEKPAEEISGEAGMFSSQRYGVKCHTSI